MYMPSKIMIDDLDNKTLKELGDISFLRAFNDFMIVNVVGGILIFWIAFYTAGVLDKFGFIITIPYGSYYIPSVELDWYKKYWIWGITNGFFILLSSILFYYRRNFGAFISSFRVYADTLPVLGIIMYKGEGIYIGWVAYNEATQLITEAPSSFWYYDVIILGSIMTILAITIQLGIITRFVLARIEDWILTTILTFPLILFITFVHEMGHAFFSLVFNVPIVAFGITLVGAFVGVGSWAEYPVLNVLIAGGGNFFVILLIAFTIRFKNRIAKMIRDFGAYITLLNSIPVFAFGWIAGYGAVAGLIPSTDGSLIFIVAMHPYFSIIAIIVAIILTDIFIDVSAHILSIDIVGYPISLLRKLKMKL